MGFLSSVMGFLCSPPIILFFPQLRSNLADLDWLLVRLSILLLVILYLVLGFLSSVMGFLCSPPIILFFPQLRSNQVDLDWLLVRLSILLLCRELANFFIFCATNLCFRCRNPDKQLFLGLSRPVHAVWVGLTFHAETWVWFSILGWFHGNKNGNINIYFLRLLESVY